MRSNHARTRRRFLGALSASGLAGLAGCSNTPTGSTSTATTPEPGQPIQETSFEGEYLVVRLADDHEVSRVNLIDPNGELFTQATVAQGETTVRLQILDMGNYGTNAEHYPPGDYEIVSVAEESTSKFSLSLEPKLELIDVAQFSEPEGPGDHGKLTITLKNSGNAPSWVYDVAYQGSPNYVANRALQDDRGHLLLSRFEKPADAIIYPGETGSFIGTSVPLLFRERGQCTERDFQFQIEVGRATGKPLSREIKARTSGEPQSSAFSNAYTCEFVDVKLVDGEADE